MTDSNPAKDTICFEYNINPQHIVSLCSFKRRPKPRSISKVLDRMNLVYRFLLNSYSEATSDEKEADRLLLRDALLEGFILGLQWSAGGKDYIGAAIKGKTIIERFLYQSPYITGES